MYVICRTRLGITSEQFFEMTLLEIEHMLKEKNRHDKLGRLDQAYYISCLVMQENANNIYENLRYSILGVDSQIRLKNDIKRYKMISERLGLKFPKEWVTK